KEQEVREREKGEEPEILPAVPKKLFHQEGEYWTIAYQGKVCRVRDAMGLRYLAYLLRYPHRQIHVLDLVAAVEGPIEGLTAGSTGERSATALAELKVQAGLGNAGARLDPQAKAEYKQRLGELRAELEDAQACNDPGRIARVRQELEFLTQELSNAVGLGGRDRKDADVAERARVNVQRALKAALQKLSTLHPTLGSYLSGTINTGTYCSYAPDLSLPSPWRL